MIVFVFLFGAAIGSFLNVVIYRLPIGESPLAGRSKCPSCGSMIRFTDNIPILSFLLLGGKCRNKTCQASISLRYPVVELFSGLVVSVNFLLYSPGISFVWASAFVLMLLPMAFIDAQHFIIPDQLTIGGVVLGIALSISCLLFRACADRISPEAFTLLDPLRGLLVSLRDVPIGTGPVPLPNAIAGSLVGGGFLYAVSIFGKLVLRKEAMGMGDVKMMVMIGAFLGLEGALLTIFLGSLIGSVVFLPYFIYRRLRRSGVVATDQEAAGEDPETGPAGEDGATRTVEARPDPEKISEGEGNAGEEEEEDPAQKGWIPFGVFLAAGGFLSLYFGEYIVGLYLGMFW